MIQNELLTIGRKRSECIESLRNLLGMNDVNNYEHLRIENERYYNTLDDNGEAQSSLKERWDKIALWKQNQLKVWERKWSAADSMDKHDLIERKKQLLYLYEKERSICVENNYYYFKTYMDESDVDYPLE